MKRILTGIQPTGTLHIGNYFGAIKPILDYQDKEDLFLFVASYHALTTIKDKNILKQNIFNASVDMLSLGIDPEKTTFFNQSNVKEVLELYLILSNLVPLPHLERAHAYKDKVSKGITSNHGLFSYPILMAADILLYNTDLVPVGKDQIQHIQIARDIAVMFNNTYGDYFKLPEFKVDENTSTILGIDGQKMSKSYNNTIPIFFSKKDLKKIISSIKTDSTPLELSKDYNSCLVYSLCKLFMNETELEVLKERYNTPGEGYGHFKLTLLDKINDYFEPYYSKREYFLSHPNIVKEIMVFGEDKARNVASDNLSKIRDLIGI